jgi:hypothetical protein
VQSLRTYTTACDKVKEAIRQYINRQELDLVEHPNQAAFYKYVSRTLGKQQTQHQLVDGTGKAVSFFNIKARIGLGTVRFCLLGPVLP